MRSGKSERLRLRICQGRAVWAPLVLLASVLSILFCCLSATWVETSSFSPLYPTPHPPHPTHSHHPTHPTHSHSHSSSSSSSLSSRGEDDVFAVRPWDAAATAGGPPLIGIGPSAHCRPAPVCRLCGEMQLRNAAADVNAAVSAYLARHVLFGVVTGHFDDFFRVDLALCTWLGHVPRDRLFVFTNGANASGGRYGIWVETDDAPMSRQLHAGMLRGTGYSIGWMRAQYRFFHAFLYFAALLSTPGQEDTQWAVIVDDDTFVDLHALTARLRLRLQQSRRQRPFALYISDAGWGGAGHVANAMALRRFAAAGRKMCVRRQLIEARRASDTALRRCVPAMGIRSERDAVLSHCQARRVGHRMLQVGAGAMGIASLHAKRDQMGPKRFAMWRMRLYYQVVYHRNRTAFDVLMRVGACAYGYTCKQKNCRHEEDRAALEEFMRRSGNDSYVPLY